MGRRLESRWKTKVERTLDRMETPCPFLFPYPQIPINTESDDVGVTTNRSAESPSYTKQ